jgi:hypothetical protein
LEELSAHLGDLYENEGGPNLIPNGGYHAVLEALHHRIASDDDTTIQLGCAVESINYCTKASSTKNEDDQVQITLQTNTDDDSHNLNPSSVVMGDYCICTVPLGVLQQRKIAFVPNLPEH